MSTAQNLKYLKQKLLMPAPSKYTLNDAQLVWSLFSEGKGITEIKEETGFATGTIYRLLEKAQEKWGIPKR